jgi:hypothetical protein
MTAGVDLGLALIENDLGPELSSSSIIAAAAANRNFPRCSSRHRSRTAFRQRSPTRGTTFTRP